MKNILHITNELNTVDGVTNHIYVLLKTLSKSYDGNIYLLSGGGDNNSLFDGIGVTTAINPALNHKNRNLRNFASAVRYVRKFAEENKIGIIHSHNHYAANIARYASGFSNIKTVQTNHGLFPDKGKLSLFNSDYHIVLTNRIFLYLVENLKINESRIRLISPGIENRFVHEHQKRLKTFHASGRFVREKGIDKYIIAANDINKKFPGEYKFTVSGKGVEELKLRELNRNLGNAVEFTDDYYGALASTSVYVFPSDGSSESLPAVLIEAIMAGCVVVSSFYEGVEEIFPGQYSELLFDPGDLNDVIGKIKYAADNAGLVLNKFKDMYGDIKEKFRPEKMSAKHVVLYGEISESPS